MEAIVYYIECTMTPSCQLNRVLVISLPFSFTPQGAIWVKTNVIIDRSSPTLHRYSSYYSLVPGVFLSTVTSQGVALSYLSSNIADFFFFLFYKMVLYILWKCIENEVIKKKNDEKGCLLVGLGYLALDFL